MTNLKQISLALHIYAEDNNQQFPSALAQIYPKDISSPSAFWCPSDKNHKPAVITGNDIDAAESARISYQYNSGQSASGDPNLPLVWDNGCGNAKLDNHGKEGGNVVYLDGRVSWLPTAQWQVPVHGDKSYPGPSRPETR